LGYTKKTHEPTQGEYKCVPSPSVAQYHGQEFFASTKDYYQWNYKLKDFSYDGGYVGFFAAICKKRRMYDVSKTIFLNTF
jgi:hypothetical protein